MPILLSVGATPDDRSFKQVADRAEKFFGDVGKSASGSFSKGFADGAKDVRKATDAYVQSYESIVEAAGRAKVAETQRQQHLDKSKSLADKAAKAEEGLAKARDSKDAKAVAAAERDLERVRDQQARTNTALVRSTETAERARRTESRQVREATQAYRELEAAQRRAATPGFGRSFDSYTRGDGGVFGGALSQSSGIVGQFQSLGGNAGRGFVAGAAAAIAAGGLVAAGAKAADMVLDGFKSVMSTGIDFSSTVNNFQGVTGASAGQTQQMAQAARALGADTTMAGVSSSEAAEAMTELAKAGFSVDQALSAARGTMELATAAQVSGAQAAEIQANAMNAFGLSADKAGHVADVLANAAVGSSADIPDLALGLQQVGGVAKGFGNSIEDTVAALGMFANAGIKGSDAGTLLKTTLQAITDQGNPAQAAIQNLGLSLYDFGTGQFVGFRELFRQLDEAKARMSPEQFQAQSNILFGSDAMRAAMLGNVQSFDTMRATIDRIGTAGDMAKAKMQGWPGVMSGIKKATGELKLSLYDIFDSPAGQEFGSTLVESLNGFVGWVKEHKPEIIGFVSEVGSAMATLADGFLGYVARMLDASSVWQQGLSATFGNAIEAAGKTADVFGGLIKHIPGFKSIGEAIQGAGQSAAGAMDNWQKMPAAMRDAADGIDKLREGIRGTRDDFTGAMRDTQAAEAQNRLYAGSFKEIASAVRLVPETKQIELQDNSPEVMAKLEALGFKVLNLPNGRILVEIEYNDPAGKVIPRSQLGVSQRQRDDVTSRTHSWAGGGNTAPTVMPTAPSGGWPAMPSSGGGGGGSSAAKSNPVFGEDLWKVGAPGFAAFAGVRGSDPQKVYDAQSAELNARNNLEQSKLKLLQLEADNTTDQLALISARNQVQENERAWQKAQRELIDAQNGLTTKSTESAKSFTDGMGQIGAALDNDFGISNGLPGIAENLVKFVASLAAAPLLGPLSVMSNKGESGSGLFGMAAGTGAFGDRYLQQRSVSEYLNQQGPQGYSAISGYAGDAALLANVPAGSYSQSPARDLLKGLSDCSSSIGDLVNILDGVPTTSGENLTTGNADQWLPQHGFLPGRGGPGDFRVGFNSGHMQATLPGGTNFNWGSDAAAARGGVGGTGAFDPSLTSHYYRPVASTPGGPGGGFSQTAGVTGVPTTPLFPPLSGPALTDPGLTPPVSGGGTGMGGGFPGMAGPPQFLPGVGGGFPALSGSAGVPALSQGQQYQGGTGEGFSGLGGLPMAAIQGAIGAAGGAGGMFGGQAAAALADMGVKVLNRTAAYAGQMAGIGAQGLMETVLPSGDNPLSNIGNSWLGKLAGGLVGARPALPNMASQQSPLQAPDGKKQGEQPQQGNVTNNINVTNQRATEDGTGRDIRREMAVFNQPGKQ